MTTSPDAPSAPTPAPEDELAAKIERRSRFKTRHLSMMALGSAIGAGFFLGTGEAIAAAGPAVLVSYALAAFIAVSVMYALAELASAMPSTGSFSTYAEVGVGRWAGFTVGWMYWFMLIMVLGLETTGAASYFTLWFPAVPQWLVALVIVIVLGGVNLLAAGQFGEVEAWLAGVKVAALAVFLLIGALLILGVVPGREAPVAQTLLGHGGWLPKGMSGVAVALLAVITSFGGIEVVTIAAAEAEDARTAMTKAIRSVVGRILVFYVGSVIVLASLIPWDSEAMTTSPFGTVLGMAGVPYVKTVMEIIIFFALVSAFSAIVYGSSRMAYSLAARGMGPVWLLGRDAAPAPHGEGVEDGTIGRATMVGDIDYGRTPRRAVWVSIILALVSVAMNWWLPEDVLGIFLNAIGMVLLVAWLFIIIAHIRLRPRIEAAGLERVRMPGSAWLPWVVLVSLGALAVLIMFNEGARIQLISTGVLMALVVVLYFIREVWLERRA